MRSKMILVYFLLLLPILGMASEGGNEGTGEQLTHRMMLLVIQLGCILFAAKIGNMLFEKFRMPGVLGELMAGILIGPSVLGSLSFPGFPHGLFPHFPGQTIPVSPELYGFCSVAAIVLLFTVGLETDIHMFLRYCVAGGVVGIGGVLFSFGLGAWITMLMSNYVFGHSLNFFDKECLFLGVISTATSVGITARILAEQKKLDGPEGVTILSGAVIDDVLGIITLAIVLGLISSGHGEAHGIQWGKIGLITIKAVGIWLTATILGILSSHKIGWMLKLFKERSAIAVMALGIALILSGLFEEAGLAMIIGAYVTGLSLSQTDIAHMIKEKLTPVYTFLVPIFFVVMGMLVDLHALGKKEIFVFGLIYTIVAIIAKIVGCGLPVGCFGFNLIGMLRVGVGMVPRGEVALIVAGIGLAVGALPSDVFGVAIMMTFLTTICIPPLLVLVFKIPKPGLRRSLPTSQETSIEFNFPSEAVTEWVKNKLLGVFDQEGFFIHEIEQESPLFHLRKDNVIINMEIHNQIIRFNTDPSVQSYLNTAIYHVLGELQSTIRGLQKPIDLNKFGKNILASPTSGQAKHILNLADFIEPHLLIPQLRANTKKEILRELLQPLLNHGIISDVETTLQALIAREESMSTGLEQGIAIPHARVNTVNNLVCVIGLKPEGIDFQSLDGEPSRIFILSLSPESKPAPHVQFLSTISRILTPEKRQALLACRTPEAMYHELIMPITKKSGENKPILMNI